jgi:hypothetical protein
MGTDVRHHDFSRTRRWGRGPLVLAQIDASGIAQPVEKLMKYFSVSDTRDETTGQIVHTFSLHDMTLDPTLINEIDAIVYDGATYEVQSKELKRRDPAHWLFQTVRYQGGLQG